MEALAATTKTEQATNICGEGAVGGSLLGLWGVVFVLQDSEMHGEICRWLINTG